MSVGHCNETKERERRERALTDAAGDHRPLAQLVAARHGDRGRLRSLLAAVHESEATTARRNHAMRRQLRHRVIDTRDAADENVRALEANM